MHFIIHFFRKEYLFCSNFLFRSALFKVPEKLSMPKDVLQECLLWSKHNPAWFSPTFSTTWHETCVVNPNAFPQKNLPNYVFHAPRSQRQLKSLGFSKLANNVLQMAVICFCFQTFHRLSGEKNRNILCIKDVKLNKNHNFKYMLQKF